MGGKSSVDGRRSFHPEKIDLSGHVLRQARSLVLLQRLTAR